MRNNHEKEKQGYRVKMKEKKYKSFYEYILDVAETVWEQQKGDPARYIILSPKQFEILKKVRTNLK